MLATRAGIPRGIDIPVVGIGTLVAGIGVPAAGIGVPVAQKPGFYEKPGFSVQVASFCRTRSRAWRSWLAEGEPMRF